MRVLQINSVCGYGSTGRIATDLYDILIKAGHECCIAYGRGSAPEGYNTIKIGNKFDFYGHILKSRIFDLHGFGSKKATNKLIEEIENYNPDIIHLHNLHGYYLNVEILFNYLSSTDKAVVWLLHDQWAFSGHSAYFELDSNGEIPEGNLLAEQKSNYPKSWLRDNSKDNFIRKKQLFTKVSNMTIITPSNGLSELTRKSFLSIYPCEVINNGIDLTIFKPTKSSFRENYNLTNHKIILGVSSIWDERKGLKYFEMLAKKLDDKYKIVLVGIDPKTKKSLSDKVISINRTSNIRELAEIYSSADIFVNPTLEDNFPTTNIEALACGTPVITFNTGGSPEAIDSETGFVVPKDNSQKLVESIIEFPYHFDYKNKCVLKSLNYGKKITYEKYIKLYESLLESK